MNRHAQQQQAVDAVLKANARGDQVAQQPTPSNERIPSPHGDATVKLPEGARNPDIAVSEKERSSRTWSGQRVFLANGLTIPDKYSSSGHVMAPISNLGAVAAAGKEAGTTLHTLLISSVAAPLAAEYIRRRFKESVGQGGEFDYQRKADEAAPGKFIQLPQFRNISNVNVGLFAQQAGMSLHETLQLSGIYAAVNSSNFRPGQPYGLDTRTKEFIEIGFEIGKRGTFDDSKLQLNR